MSTALDTVQPHGALAVPEHLRDEHGNEGLENVTKADLVIQRISICQSTNDERKKTKDKYIEGLSDGDLFNSVTKQIYGTKVQIIALSFTKSRIYFKPPVGSGVILCRSNNGIDGGTIAPTCAECPNMQFGADGAPPICTEFANFPVLLLPDMDLLLLSLKSTALPAARKWITLMKFYKKAAFANVFEIRTVEKPMPKGTCFTPVITRLDWTPAKLYDQAKAAFADFSTKKIIVEEPEDDESPEVDKDIPF